MMKHLLTISLIAVSIVTTAFAQSHTEPAFVPGELIVQITPQGSIENVVNDNRLLNGDPTLLRTNRLLSGPMHAYLLTFDPTMDHDEIRRAVNSHSDISIVQFNHYIQNRILPNDPQLNQQWWHTNINSDEAWDITTGGLTATGDTIVVCVVDDGGDLDHPDLMANNWVNHNEIPDNGQDDDNNGYIDDHFGWNPVGDNDNIDGGGHGVNVAGMIGAVGDNSTGVVGVNWGVEIMNMTYGNINNEADVIEAYTYPLIMRNLYESSGGALGAFVVATNSSWGIDGGDPADAPLWCAFYDTLGAAGILSCGATANNNVNIDAVGDLPTACSSEYMVAVTATNDNDVRTFSGYGATTIDLGAPGEDVTTTSSGGGYTSTSGTSFASPCTAGAIALVYSSPCASLSAIAHSDPALGAQMVRDAIFDGVDPIANLNGECVTGGRLNTKNAIDEIMNNCAGGGCMTPFNLTANSVTDISASIDWGSLPDQDSFNLAWGVVNGGGSQVNDITSPYSLTGLTACTDYFVLVQADCDTAQSDWSDTLFFSTDGCCLAPGLVTIDSFTATTASVSWTPVLAANSYLIHWRPLGGSWTEMDNITATSIILDIDSCTVYEVEVATNCTGSTTDFSAAATFTSAGCGACTDATYCESTSDNADDDWIDQVELNTLDNTSGSDGGYGDYTDMSTELDQGSTHLLTVTPDYDYFFALTVTTYAWIDWNQNGSFEANELVLGPETNTADVPVSAQVTVAGNAMAGATRMRIKVTEGNSDDPCEAAFNYGEVEDYCVVISDTGSVTPGVSEASERIFFRLMPNPTADMAILDLNRNNSDTYSMMITDLQGRVLFRMDQLSDNRTTINLSEIASGTYLIRVADNNGISATQRLVVK